MQEATHVALLRGINVGGNKKVPMAELRELCEQLGFKNVKTLLNTGNVLFSAKGSEPALAKKIETAFTKHFGFSSNVIVRSRKDIETLVKSDPFKKVKVTKDIRLYITFMSAPKKSSLKIPYVSPDKSFTILAVRDRIIVSVLNVAKRGTVDAMSILEQEFGKNITTRNWNTVQKFTA